MRGRNLKKMFDAINLLAQPTGTTISSICSHLEIDQRQAYRVIETLQLDFKFIIDKEKPVLGGEVRYFLDKDHFKRLSDMKVADLNLSLPEIIALYFLKGHAKLYRGTEMADNVERAFTKLDAFVPAGLADKLDRVKTLVIPAERFVKDYSEKEEIINQLTDAMLQQKTCRLEYHSFSNDATKTYNIDPLKFFDWNGGLYLFVRVTAYGDIRLLAVERIIEISVGKAGFDYPNNFEPDDLLEGAFGIVYDDPITVTIRFSASQAPYIKERRWAVDQRIKEQDDGSITLTMTTSGWFDVRKWILSFGPNAELIEPVDKREELKAMLWQSVDLYGGVRK